MSLPLPPRPHLDLLRKLAKERLVALRGADSAARLADAQLAVARDYGFGSWRALKAHVDAAGQAIGGLLAATRRGDVETMTAILDRHPALVNAAAEDRAARVLPTDTRAMRLLHVAVAEDRPAAARLLIDRGADLDARNADGRTALHDCIEVGRDEIEAMLLAAGATVDVCAAAVLGRYDRLREILAADAAQANDLSTNLPPMGWAAYGRRAESVRILLDHGARLDPPFDAKVLGPTAQVAATDVLRLLLARGVSADWRGEGGRSLLHLSIGSRITPDPADFVGVLLDAGADVDATDEAGRTPLDVALAVAGATLEDYATGLPLGTRRLDRAIALLRGRGARAGEQVLGIDPRIVQAAAGGDVAGLARLLDAHPEKVSLAGGRWGQPLLHLAATGGHVAVVDALLARGFDVNTRDKADNAYALHFAAENGNLSVVKRLVEAGGDVHGDGDDHELGVLGWATCFAHTRRDVADYLIACGARPHIFAAIALDRADLVRQLVSADPTLLGKRMSRNEHRRTPLHHAVSKNRPAMVGLLLDLGADPYLRDDAGATPAAYASDPAVDRAIFDRLRIDGAKPDLVTALALGDFAAAADLLAADPAQLAPGGSSDRALHFLASRRNVAAVRWLVDHGADVNAKRVLWNCNQTALHVCAEHGIADVAEVLLDAGADTTIRDDRYNAPPLGWATHCDRPAVAALLRSRGATE